MVSVYAPNPEQIAFLVHMSTQLSLNTNTDIVIGGDFNMIENIDIDRSTPPLLERPYTGCLQDFKIGYAAGSWKISGESSIHMKKNFYSSPDYTPYT